MTKHWHRIKLWVYILLFCGLLRAVLAYTNLHGPLELDGEVHFQVVPGQPLTQVLDQLADRGILAHPFDLRVYARLTGQAASIQAGEYALREGLTPLGLLQRMVRGDVLSHRVVLVEGWTAQQALAAIQAHEAVRATLAPGDPESLRQALALELSPEGQFFPDTYNFTRGTTDLAILRRAHGLLQQVLAREWEGREVGLPYDSPYEALIMASIVEKETAVSAERERIAGVFVRRLRQGMRLQTDPTVIYGLGAAYTGNLTRADLRGDSPYNTYRRRGLPPTPIALPGRGAIAASLHPDDSGALYFVSRGDGTHQFSTTLEEHNAAVRRYQINGDADAPPPREQ